MKIFVAHSSGYDYKNELYLPIRTSQLSKDHAIKLPKETDENEVITKDIIKNSDVVIAEVSYPSTGQGIELGWADIFEKPIICIYKSGFKPSKALGKLTDRFIEYTNAEDIITKLTDSLSRFPPSRE